MPRRILEIIALIISIQGTSQINQKLLLGQWKLISEKNSNISFVFTNSDQHYIQFFSNGSFREIHKRNEEWKKGEWIKGTYHHKGKWKINGDTLIYYQQSDIPPRKNTSYGDHLQTFVSLTSTEMYLNGHLQGGHGEGVYGTLYYKKMRPK